jgi:hypothetical protein
MKFATHKHSPLDELLSADYLGAKSAPIGDLGVELVFQGDQFQQLLVTVQASGALQSKLLGTLGVHKLRLSILYKKSVDLVRKMHDDGSISEVNPTDGSVTVTKNGSKTCIRKKKGELIPLGLPDGSTVTVTEDGDILRNVDSKFPHLRDNVGLEFYIDFKLGLTKEKSVPVRFDPAKFELFLKRAKWEDLIHKYLSFALSALTGYFSALAKLLLRKEEPLRLELFDRAHMLPIWHCTAHTYVEDKIRSPHDEESARQERVTCCDDLLEEGRVEQEGLLFTMHAMKLQEDVTALIVAFRGTIVDDLRNWVVNVTANWTPVYGGAAQAHTGNLNAWKLHLRPLVERELLRLSLAGHCFSRIIFTGHSLGGALATIAAADFAAGTRVAKALKSSVATFMDVSASWADQKFTCWAKSGIVPQISVVTFAQPKCGNHEFARLYNERLGGADNHIRFFNFSDVVPTVPNDGFRDGSTTTVVTYPNGSSTTMQAVPLTDDASSEMYSIRTKTDDGTTTEVVANGKYIEIVAANGIVARVKSEPIVGGCKVTISDGGKQIELTVTADEATAKLPDGRNINADTGEDIATNATKTVSLRPSRKDGTISLVAEAGTFERAKRITVTLLNFRRLGVSVGASVDASVGESVGVKTPSKKKLVDLEATVRFEWAPITSVVLLDNTEINVRLSYHPTSPRKVTTTYNHLDKSKRKVSVTTDKVGYIHVGVDVCLSGGLGSKLMELSNWKDSRSPAYSHSCLLHDEGMRRYYDGKPDIQLPEDLLNVTLKLYHKITPLVSMYRVLLVVMHHAIVYTTTHYTDTKTIKHRSVS